MKNLKSYKQILILLLGIVIALSGVFIYNSFFSKEEIDVMPKLSVKFYGVNKYGFISDINAGAIQYDQNDKNLENFVNGVTYSYTNKKNLKNGDVVTIKAKYDKEKADYLGLKIKNETKTVKVKGLKKVYKTCKEMPDDVWYEAQDDAKKAIENTYNEYTIPKTNQAVKEFNMIDSTSLADFSKYGGARFSYYSAKKDTFNLYFFYPLQYDYYAGSFGGHTSGSFCCVAEVQNITDDYSSIEPTITVKKLEHFSVNNNNEDEVKRSIEDTFGISQLKEVDKFN